MEALDSRLGVAFGEIADGKIFVLRMELDAESPDWRERISVLAVDERARVDRYRFEGDAAKFAQSRFAARSILGAAINCLPERVEIEYSDSGKPHLSERQARALGTREPLTFNISHSGDLCLIALGAYECLGVDVEERLDSDDLQKLADRFFAPKEASRLRALPLEQRVNAFYACWTRKEALIKALGHGMQYGIDKYEVFHDGDACSCLLDMPGGAEEASRWTVADLDSGDEAYAAALAVRAASVEIEVADWRG